MNVTIVPEILLNQIVKTVPKGLVLNNFFHFLDLQGVCGATFVFLTSSALVMCADFCVNELGEGSFC